MAKSGRRVRIFSALEVANICGVVNQTAINWIRNGHLKAFTTPGGQYRIYAKDLAAFLDQRGMNASGDVLQVLMEDAEWNSFLIAAEPSLNDSLKAEMESFLSNYMIIQAHDWFEVGRKITEEKPGFILLDADLPGVDISKFIRTVKEDPFFGRPNIFLLSNNASAESSNGHLNRDKKSGDSKRADMVFSKPLDVVKFEAVMKSMERQISTAIA